MALPHWANALLFYVEIVLVNNLCKGRGVRKHNLDDAQALCVAEATPDCLSETPADFQLMAAGL
jgi:hypothetical protein